MHAQQDLVADYVIVGAGAMGLAFLDVLLDRTDAEIILIDRRDAPGGHWRGAYPFVQLHNVSAVYGVHSRELGEGRTASSGPEAGFMERAGRDEILAYYDAFLHERALASGRVRWLPRHEWREGGALSLEDGAFVGIRARKRIVDATFTDTQTPSTQAPAFPVAPGVRVVTPNQLPEAARDAGPFTIIGAGKTAMDCASFLLDEGVAPEAIAWVRPRDAWLLNRACLQPNEASFVRTMEGFAADQEAAAAAHSVENYFARLEQAGVVHRIDQGVEPSMFRCAIASEHEIRQWRRITNVIRAGRVRAIDERRMLLARGEVAARPGETYVHCTADGIPKRAPVPVFRDGLITLQYVRRCAPPLSAAMIALVEALDAPDERKNALCEVVPMVNEPRDWVLTQLIEARGRGRWAAEPALRDWLNHTRLDGFAALISRVMQNPTAPQATAFERWARGRGAGLAGLRRLADGLEDDQLSRWAAA